MGDHRLIAAVTATLRHILEVAVGEVGSDARVRVGSASGQGSTPEVCVRLVRAVPNEAFRTADLPRRSAAGELIARPQTALDLYYLLAFDGDPESLLPERLLGACVSRLEARPVVGADVVAAAIQEAAAEGVELEGCGLETLRFVPAPGFGDETAGLRAAFSEGRAPLALTYRCTVLLPLEAAPRSGPPSPG